VLRLSQRDDLKARRIKAISAIPQGLPLTATLGSKMPVFLPNALRTRLADGRAALTIMGDCAGRFHSARGNRRVNMRRISRQYDAAERLLRRKAVADVKGRLPFGVPARSSWRQTVERVGHVGKDPPQTSP
jgi:hypothetical protein